MTSSPKSLGQVKPAAATPTKLYTGAAAAGSSPGGAVCRVAINLRPAAAADTAQVAIEIRRSGAGSAAEDYYWEGPVSKFTLKELVFAVSPADEVWVTSDVADTNFNLTGIEA